jgi:hypothetical protein
MTAIALWLRGLALPARWGAVGAAGAGMVGALTGLVIGLIVYMPTAPFAAIEVGLPAAIVGGVFGVVAGAVVSVARWGVRNDR